MTLTIYEDLEQGTDEWLALRCGVVTASIIGKLITPKTVKVASNDTSRAAVEALVAERIEGKPEEVWVSSDMDRGTRDEPFARDLYARHHAPVDEIGFMVRDDWGFQIGFSPDGLVGDDGLIEIKSRKPKIQMRTIIRDEVPLENMAQIQTGLLVSGRDWLDYVSYAGGWPLYVKRVLPDPRWQSAIVEAVAGFEEQAQALMDAYAANSRDLPVAEYIDFSEEEIY